jgi:hypothetical protein
LKLSRNTNVSPYSRRALQTRWATAADAFAIARIAFATGHGPFPSSPDQPRAAYDAATADGATYLVADFGGILAGVAELRGASVALWVPERFVDLHVAETLLDAIDTWHAGGERLAS